MKLENIVKSTEKFVKENKNFCVGATFFTIGAFMDAYITTNVVNSGIGYELNPIPKFLMNSLGVEFGLVAHKLAFGIPIICGCKYVKNDKLLYLGGIAQILAATSWYIFM